MLTLKQMVIIKIAYYVNSRSVFLDFRDEMAFNRSLGPLIYKLYDK